VTYTGNGSAGATIGHGLGIAPKMFIVKNRSNAGNDWSVWHTSISPASNFQVYLSSTAAQLNTWNVWNSTSPSSTTLTLGNDALVNGSTQTYVAYCWAAIPGYSAFTSYASNNSVDGPFVYLGFRPKFVMIKPSTFADQWMIFDSSRNAANLTNNVLYPNLSNAEAVDANNCLDLLSNGFKIRGTGGSVNYLSNTYIVMAFAENPFRNSLAR
jgi:hypothetical protein